jgi:hypothetical protein
VSQFFEQDVDAGVSLHVNEHWPWQAVTQSV